MDVLNRFLDGLTIEIFKDEEYLATILGTFALGIWVSKSVIFGILLAAVYSAGTVALVYRNKLYDMFTTESEEEQPEEQTTEEPTGTLISLGTIYGTEEPVLLSVEALNHVLIPGMTRYGKTRLALALVAEFIENFTPEELLLAFSDAKDISFNVFAKSKHLYAPIAGSVESTEVLIERLVTEMYSRLALFKEYDGFVCTSVSEYSELSGTALPRIIVIFDELADSVMPNSEAEKNLRTLAKMGLAAGIQLVMITQRTTNLGVAREVTSQSQTIMSCYMKSSTEYGSITGIPKAIYKHMKAEKGLFMVFSPDLAPLFLEKFPGYEGWGFVKTRYMANHTIERIAARDKAEERLLEPLETNKPQWRGSTQDKLDAIEDLDIKHGEVTVELLQNTFGLTKRTAKAWLGKYNA
jgi:hypothetical protein